MKRIIICIICLLLFVTLIACGAANKQTTNTNQETDQGDNITKDPDIETGAAEREQEFAFTQQSLQGFIDRVASQNSVLSNNQTAFFVRAANSATLDIEDYSVLSVNWLPSQKDDGTLSGNLCLDIYWHKDDCASCSKGYCGKIILYLKYINGGVSTKGILERPGYIQTEEPKLYMKELAFSQKVSYIYLIDNCYYFSCSIDNDVPKKEQIVEQFVTFGKEMKAYLDSNQNHEIS